MTNRESKKNIFGIEPLSKFLKKIFDVSVMNKILIWKRRVDGLKFNDV